MDDAGAVHAGKSGIRFDIIPEINAVDFAVRIPEGAMVVMIMFLAFASFDRPLTGHGRFARAEDWIEVRARRAGEAIFGEWFAVDFDAQAIVQLGDQDAIGHPDDPARLAEDDLDLAWIALPLLAIRLAMAIACGWLLLGSRDVWKYCYAIPLRDLCGVAVWVAGLMAHTVVWRDQQLKLDAEGRIISRQQ